MEAAPVRVRYVVIDCADPESLASFWSYLLGVPVAGRFGDGAYVFLQRQADDAPSIAFQRVPEGKSTKNRVHLDLTVEDLDMVSSWVESQGGARGPDHEEDGYRWRVMQDPAGNEFCLVPRDQA